MTAVLLVMLTAALAGIACYDFICVGRDIPTGQTSKMMILSGRREGPTINHSPLIDPVVIFDPDGPRPGYMGQEKEKARMPLKEIDNLEILHLVV